MPSKGSMNLMSIRHSPRSSLGSFGSPRRRRRRLFFGMTCTLLISAGPPDFVLQSMLVCGAKERWMNGAGEINEAASTAEVGGLDPREAARILEQTKRQARRQFDPQSALAAIVGAGVFLFGYGAVWWSMHDQHVYSGPASWSLVVLYGLIAVSAIAGGVVSSRANAG